MKRYQNHIKQIKKPIKNMKISTKNITSTKIIFLPETGDVEFCPEIDKVGYLLARKRKL